MKSKNLRKENAKLIALFFLQYSLLLPIMSIFNPTVITAILGVLIISIVLISNFKSPIKIKTLAMFMLMLGVLLLKSFQSTATVEVVFYYIAIAGPPMVMFLYPFDNRVFLETAIKWSKVGFWIVCWNPFIGLYNYMRFGYAMLPIIILIYIDLIYFGKNMLNVRQAKLNFVYDVILIVLGTLELVLYGARGALFSLVLFWIIERFFINKKRIIKNVVILIVCSVLFIYMIPILNFLERLTQTIGIYSYSITKFKMQIAGGIISASSGRDVLYEQSIEKIRENPIIGNIISIEGEGDYSHNLFLQVAKDLGIIALVILIVFLLWVICKLWSNNTKLEEKLIYAILFAVAVGRLMFSSILWMRPEFWMLCFCVVSNFRKSTHGGQKKGSCSERIKYKKKKIYI